MLRGGRVCWRGDVLRGGKDRLLLGFRGNWWIWERGEWECLYWGARPSVVVCRLGMQWRDVRFSLYRGFVRTCVR